MKKSLILATTAVACCIATIAEAHVGVTPAEVPAGQATLVGFGIGHGCDGAPTTAIRMRIPEGVIAVQPVAKPGWDIAITTGTYATPQIDGEALVTEGVTMIEWTGGNLPDAFYDQFWIRARVATGVEHGAMMWFPIVQECAGGGVHRWITVPVEGQPEADEPTPGFAVGEPAEGGHGH
ncbi:MAG: YcnI family copper-binding membrane protein [Bauldia sp.]|jgi:uncharacterized protein YcnI